MQERKHRAIAAVVSNEWKTGESNQSDALADYEGAIDLFNNTGSDREYEWQSDISIPEFSTQQLTQSALDVSQYFQTRDFIETYIQDPSDEALFAADAAEECINRTLNMRTLYHYQKFVRAKSLSNITGEVIAECWWEKDGTKDNFNYDIVPAEHVAMSSEYTYSLQQKKWIIIRTEKDLDELKRDARRSKYFNLDLLEETEVTQDTAIKTKLDEATGQDTVTVKANRPQSFTIYKRYGKYWILDGEIGVDENGKPLEGAKWEEVVMEVAVDGSNETLIAFHRQPYMEEATGIRYRPIIRGKCYVHPVEDHGLGDARFSRPLAAAINDTFNVSNDRVMLATLPTLKVKENSYENEDDVFIAPGHKIEVTDTDDLQEFRFSDNVSGAISQMSILLDKMQQANSIYPSTMGAGPERVSETATAVASGERHSNQRSNYKTTTFEYTFLNELYYMILNMTYQWANPETGEKLMGEKIADFNPGLDYFYKPLSQSIETEYSKNNKIKQLNTLFGYVASMPQPKPELINYMIAKIFMLMGDEYVNMADKMITNENLEKQEEGGQEQPAQQGIEPGTVSNQNGIEMSGAEEATRETTF